jgi:hypothetical protein
MLLNRLAIAALVVATCCFPAAALVPASHGDSAPRLEPAPAAARAIAAPTVGRAG